KTIALSRMIAAVTTGKRLGRRDASASGIMLTTRSSSVPGDQACAPDFPTHPPLLPKHAASALCSPLSRTEKGLVADLYSPRSLCLMSRQKDSLGNAI